MVQLLKDRLKKWSDWQRELKKVKEVISTEKVVHTSLFSREILLKSYSDVCIPPFISL